MTNGFPVFPNLPELLRQQQLIQGLQNKPQISPSQTMDKSPVPIAGQVNAPTASEAPPQTQGAPQGGPPSTPPLGPAQNAYQNALAQPAPQLSQYKPSVGRRVLGGILGGIAGMHDPASGVATGHGTVYAPFEKQEADYQSNLARLKAAADEEVNSYTKAAQAGEYASRGEAEAARAKAEKAREDLYKFQVQHPEAKFKPTTPKLYNITLHDGSKLVAHEGPNGELLDEDNQRVPAGAIENSEIQEPGKSKDDKKQLVKETGEVVDLTKGTKEKVATPVPKTTETPEEKNKEWDRRNKIQFLQRLQIQRNSLRDSLTRLDKAAQIREDQPAASTKGTAEFAKTVSEIEPTIVDEVSNLSDKIGPAEGRWNQLWVNKGGMNDPDFAGLDQDLKMYATAIVRVHFGLRGGQTIVAQLQKEFSEAQSPEDLKSRIEHANKWVESYAKMRNIKPGNSQNTPQSTPQGTVNPKDPMGILGGK